MDPRRKSRIAGALLTVLGILLAITLITLHLLRSKSHPFVVRGAVIAQNADTKRESPIADVEISAADGVAASAVRSDFSGFFSLPLLRPVEPGEPVTLIFKHPDYKPVELKATVPDRLYVAAMLPLHGEVEAELNEKEVLIKNVLVRYTTDTTTTDNIGSGVKTFQAENTGNIPCDNHEPCSPDGKWKAAIGSASLDAGAGSIFRNARVTCIAGPCPFTKIDSDEFSKGGRNIRVSVRDWSDTTTFLLQAEVFRSAVVSIVRVSYPVIFGRSLNFTLPPGAEGPSLEAEMGGSQIVFPLGPQPILSWADCDVRTEKNQEKDYRCELKQGYSFE